MSSATAAKTNEPTPLSTIRRLTNKVSILKKKEKTLKEEHANQMKSMVEDHLALTEMMRKNVRALEQENLELRAHAAELDHELGLTKMELGDARRELGEVREELMVKDVELENSVTKKEFEEKKAEWHRQLEVLGELFKEDQTRHRENIEYEKIRNKETMDDLKVAFFALQRQVKSLMRRIEMSISEPTKEGGQRRLRIPTEMDIRVLNTILKETRDLNNDRQFSGIEHVASSAISIKLTQYAMYTHGLEERNAHLEYMNEQLLGDVILHSVTIREKEYLQRTIKDLRARFEGFVPLLFSEVTDKQKHAEVFKNLGKELSEDLSKFEAYEQDNDEFRARLIEARKTRVAQTEIQQQLANCVIVEDAEMKEAGAEEEAAATTTAPTSSGDA